MKLNILQWLRLMETWFDDNFISQIIPDAELLSFAQKKTEDLEENILLFDDEDIRQTREKLQGWLKELNKLENRSKKGKYYLGSSRQGWKGGVF